VHRAGERGWAAAKKSICKVEQSFDRVRFMACSRVLRGADFDRSEQEGGAMKTRSVTDRVARGQETSGRGNGGVGDPRRTERGPSPNRVLRGADRSMTSDKSDECENYAHEVHSETTTRKSQQCEATGGFRGRAMDAGSQPSENNLDILDILAPLEKSSGNLQVFKRAQGAQWTPWEEGGKVGIRRSEFGSQGGGRRNQGAGVRCQETVQGTIGRTSMRVSVKKTWQCWQRWQCCGKTRVCSMARLPRECGNLGKSAQ
jgi:hypothetical protein